MRPGRLREQDVERHDRPSCQNEGTQRIQEGQWSFLYYMYNVEIHPTIKENYEKRQGPKIWGEFHDDRGFGDFEHGPQQHSKSHEKHHTGDSSACKEQITGKAHENDQSN